MSTFRITTRDAQGQDSTVRIEAAKATRNGAAVELTNEAGDLVGSFISVTNLVDEAAEVTE